MAAADVQSSGSRNGRTTGLTTRTLPSTSQGRGGKEPQPPSCSVLLADDQKAEVPTLSIRKLVLQVSSRLGLRLLCSLDDSASLYTIYMKITACRSFLVHHWNDLTAALLSVATYPMSETTWRGSVCLPLRFRAAGESGRVSSHKGKSPWEEGRNRIHTSRLQDQVVSRIKERRRRNTDSGSIVASLSTSSLCQLYQCARARQQVHL